MLGMFVLVAAIASIITCGVRGRSAQMFGHSVYRGAGKRKSIALTFDDGPSEGTKELLEYLREEDIRVTFFQCGLNVQRHADVAKAVHNAGHEIGNHTFSHLRLCPRLGWMMNFQSSRAIYREFYRTQKIIQSKVGVIPSLLRAPYGLRWFGLGVTQKRLGLTGVMWTVIGNDWKWNADEIAEYVLDRSSAGGIICLHDGRDIRNAPDIAETIAAVRIIVPKLKDRGFHFETVSELLQLDPYPHHFR